MMNNKELEKSLITIGITSYNSIKTIKNAINSALSQSWKNKEILIIDDFSEDGSWEIIKDFENYENIKIFRNEKNKGVGFCRNLLISNSNGKFLAFFDDDDTSEKNRLRIQYLKIIIYKKLYKINKPIFCYCKTAKKFKNEEILNLYPPGSDLLKKQVKGKQIAEFLLTGKQKKYFSGYYATCSLMAEKKDFLICKGFDENFRRIEDTEFAIRSSLKGAHFIGVNKVLVFQNMSYKEYKGLSIDLAYSLKMIKKHNNLFKSNKNYEFTILWTTFRYKFLEKKFFHAFIIFLKLWILDFNNLIKRIFSIRITIRKNFFILKNFNKFNNDKVI